MYNCVIRKNHNQENGLHIAMYFAWQGKPEIYPVEDHNIAWKEACVLAEAMKKEGYQVSNLVEKPYYA